jgi:hypothetical protein
MNKNDKQNTMQNEKPKQMDLIQYNLLNVENYNDKIRYELHDILDKYVLLITEYMIYLNEKIHVKNKIYFQYIFTRGLDTITNVFNGMLFYTKNLDLSFYHSQKAFYFYVEFIEQITETQNVFLKLSSRDAAIFVYKRTLFEINREYVKNRSPSPTPLTPIVNSANAKEVKDSTCSNELKDTNGITKELTVQDKMKWLDIYCEAYKSISSFFINNNFNFESKSELITEFALKLTTISERINYLIMDLETLNKFALVIDNMTNEKITMDKYFELVESLIKKISKGN